ncbi:PBECR2 nuclease fold domain-containing protein [Treponema putidum]|uniref:PBECR2 nuclease fold domain-containing protein n=1 Tax=Treponema putidum TaxID=221027 RepID=UPI00210291B3|nr:PBECR2 nuclease fold domain-containing protein [Treponema putidum]UTY31706.1 hypothetical protein E4N75_09605 [Treponema putidum]
MTLPIKSTPENRKLIFNAIKAKILKHLEELEKEETSEIKKTFSELTGLMLKGGKGLPVGTIREWKGKKFIKIAPGKWKPKYDSETRGARMSIAAIKRKADSCEDAHSLMSLIFENKDRFSDENGAPLACVKELSDFIEQTRIEKEKTTKKTSGMGSGGGGDDGEPPDEKTTTPKLTPRQKENLKKISKILENNVEPMPEKIDFTKENFNKLFKNGIDTPIEHVKIGENQFEKLERKNREGLLSAMADVLSNPAVIIKTADNAKLYVKTYKSNKKEKNVVSVVVDKGYINVSISTHIERNLQLAKKMDSILFERTESVHGKTPHGEKTPTNVIIPQSSEKSSKGLEKNKDNYNRGKHIKGDQDEIYVGDKTLSGTWKLVEAEAPSASHDEKTFRKTEGFPENKDGSTINDRDYENDKAAQLAVLNVAGNYDGRALSFDTPVVVTQDGVVVSGNNRTMSSKLAAEKGTDKAYIEALKKRFKKFGFTQKDLEGFKHPRIVFEIENDGDYSTDQFAQFNVSETKTMNPIEQAVKISKIIKADTVKEAAAIIGDFETMGELYADSKAVSGIFDTFEKSGIINQFTRPQYENEGVITGAGKEFVETVLIGSVVNEKNIRGLTREGCKSIRRKLVRAITPLINNKSMGGYSITDELNEAVDIIMQVNINKDKFKSVEEFAAQGSMFEDKNTVAIELAKKLENKEKEFADFMQSMNAALEPGASGQADIFFGNVETKEDVLKRMLSLKKSLSAIFSQTLATLKSFYEDNLKEYIVKSFNEAEHRRDEKGGARESENMKTIAIDFGGVINSFKSGWKGPEFTDEPVNGAFEAINILLNEGYKVIIYSTRAETVEGKNTIYNYLLGNGINIREIEVTDKKPIALVYIDDRAIKFSGNWNETLDKIKKFKTWTEKSLTYSGYPLEGRTKIHGMDISIENKKGSVRSGVDKDGHEWAIKMAYDYGYIRGTVGKDKDHVDVYIGNNPESEKVFIVHQNDPTTGKYDEDKVMIGFNSAKEAKAAYLRQYDRPGFFGKMIEMNIEEFKEKAFDKKNKGKMIA